MYECAICKSLNHSSRLHCQNCGTVPAQYAIADRPVKLGYQFSFHPVDSVVAHGAERTGHYRTVRTALKTVSFDYYAD